MFKAVVIFVFCVASCYGQTTGRPVYCGETPEKIFNCLNNPTVLSAETVSKCNANLLSECDRMKCAFRENKWLDKNNKIDKVKLTAHLNKMAKDQPQWQTVIDYVVPNCVQRDLPPEGVYLNCPAYDVMYCIMAGFIQKSPDTQWGSSADCLYPRQYAGACAVCPSDCFSPSIPYGSCNACYRVPRVPAPAA